jgi:hypothetical protein
MNSIDDRVRPELPRDPPQAPSAWRGAALQDSQEWLYSLDVDLRRMALC